MTERHYAGFWVRALATVIDTVLLLALTVPPLYLIYGESYFSGTHVVRGSWDFILSYVAPMVLVFGFWNYLSATPGKLLCGLKIIDVETGAQPKTGQFVRRYLGFIPSTLALGLGYFWVLVDERKQGWHDKLAGTAVVHQMQVGPLASS